MKVIDILSEGKRRPTEFDEVPDKKLSNDERWKLYKRRERGLQHQIVLLQDREKYILNQQMARGLLTNDKVSKSWWSMTPEEQSKVQMISTLSYEPAWYYHKESPDIDRIKKVVHYLAKLKQQYEKISKLRDEIYRRLKGLRSARTRMGLPRKY